LLLLHVICVLHVICAGRLLARCAAVILCRHLRGRAPRRHLRLAPGRQHLARAYWLSRSTQWRRWRRRRRRGIRRRSFPRDIPGRQGGLSDHRQRFEREIAAASQERWPRTRHQHRSSRCSRRPSTPSTPAAGIPSRTRSASGASPSSPEARTATSSPSSTMRER
jgi:hypothetical protein